MKHTHSQISTILLGPIRFYEGWHGITLGKYQYMCAKTMGKSAIVNVQKYTQDLSTIDVH